MFFNKSFYKLIFILDEVHKNEKTAENVEQDQDKIDDKEVAKGTKC